MDRISLKELLWVDHDLKAAENAFENAMIARSFPPKRAPADLDTLVEVLRDVARTEFDRESNLNTRAAAVAAVAGLIVTASGAIGKAVFDATHDTLRGTDRDVAVALMVIGLVAVVASMVMVVMIVLRPKQAKTRQTFFTDAVVDVWTGHDDAPAMLGARKDALHQLYVDRLLRTIALWSVRNRQKSRWLGRSWVCLALGILLIGAAGALVATELLDYSTATSLGMVAGGLILVWGVLKLSFHTGRNVEAEEAKRNEEVKAIVSFLSGTPTQRKA